MRTTLLELRDITKYYPDGDQQVIILDNINLRVESGEMIAIVGPSGSGKSTLLSIAGALLSPSSGEVVINEHNISNCKQKEWSKIRRNHIGFIFQNFQLLPFLKVKEQIKIITSDKHANERADELIRDLGLSTSINKYPKVMSGGEKQRIAIARAFMNNPDLILADEPTASLDRERGRQVVELIREETKRHQKAAVVVTHDERILDLMDAVYYLDNGKLELKIEKE